LKNDLIIKEWFETLNPKPNTKNSYLYTMQAFTDWTGKTPGELLTEAEVEIRKGLLPREKH
jgi:hypothetical protein